MSGSEELSKLYPEDPSVVLVAGQALATWVDVFGMPVPTALEAGVTHDIDFYGDGAAARDHYRVLTDRGLEVDLYFPSPGDMTPNTAKLVVRVPGGKDVHAEIDYLGSLCGYKREDEVRLAGRAIPIEFEGSQSPLHVMHPFDCLKSRIHNLATLPSKRNEQGVAQAHLAVAVVREFLARAIADDQVRHVVLPVAESVIELALSKDGIRVFHEFGIDPLDAIEVGSFPTLFQCKRWPQVESYVNRRRKAAAPKQ